MNGILLIDKPEGWTSHDVVAKLRGALKVRRIGHSGTLDPMATGLLVVFIGRATRAVEFAESDEKSYAAALRLGIKTDTQDITGPVLESRPVSVSEPELEACLAKFRGAQRQVPPMYSAVKIGGKKLYELARKGHEVERPAREITIFELSRIEDKGDDRELFVRCSKGTYIRTLCADIGEALGCGGCMAALRRTEVGSFSLCAAHTMDEVLEAAQTGRAAELLLPTHMLFEKYDIIELTEKQEARIKNGGSFSRTGANGVYRAFSASGEFLALVKLEDGIMSTIKSFYEV